MSIWLQVPLVFLAMALTDIVFALYIRRASQGRAFAAASFGVLIMLFASYVTISYVGNHWMLIPAIIGSFSGTWFAVKKDASKEEVVSPQLSGN